MDIPDNSPTGRIFKQAIKLARLVIPKEDMTPSDGTLPTLVKIGVAVFLVYPLCLPRSVKFLSYPSIASFFANIYMAGFSAFYYFHDVKGKREVEEPVREVNGVAIVNFTAVVIFCYQASLPAPAVYRFVSQGEFTYNVNTNLVSNDKYE